MIIIEVLLKLLLAIALGGLIGIEREISQKPAGFRTNILICVGSAMMMILSGLIQGKQGAGDLSRIAAGVITGIGFIGAGTIIQARGMVHGLTTAATLWVVAGLGLVVGAGYYWIAMIFTLLVILTLVLFRKIEDFYIKKIHHHYHIKIKDGQEFLTNLRKLTFHLGLKLEDFHLKKEKDISHISFFLPSTEEKEKEFNQSLTELGEILELRID
jgi:putative Mg2+ transporter-C (MgtC) family protein